MTVTFTLNSAYTGATFVAGPFNISGTTSGGITTELANGVTKQQLINGYTINDVDNTITGGTIASTGTCNTTQQWSTGLTPTPTPTLAPSTYNCISGACEEVLDGSGLYSTLQDCLANCQQTTFFCKESENAPCIEQVGPCTGGQISCGQIQN